MVRPQRRISPRDAAVRIVQRLREAGHVALLAGGCVRDALLGLEPKDYDVATDAHPEQVRRLFPRSRYVGEAFGVCLVFVEGQQVEVATFRAEWGYSDGRRPDRVAFTDAEHDARRRDFTINGLFADPLSPARRPGDAAWAPAVGSVIDHVGGVADLEARLIRAIGDADERFAEDYLRMLRAVRFAARLSFTIEPGTAAAIRPLAKYLGQISRERIGMELQAMLAPPAPGAAPGSPPQAMPSIAAAAVEAADRRARAVTLMTDLRLDGVVLNEDHRDRPPGVLGRLAVDAAYATALAAWMIDRLAAAPTLSEVAAFTQRESVRQVERWRGALALSNEDRDRLRGVLSLLARAAAWPEMGVAARKRLLAEPHWPEAWKLLRVLEGGGEAARIEADAAPLFAEGVAPEPLIGGDDLIRLGLRPGPAFGRYLEAVYDAQLEGRVTTRQEALAWVAQQAGQG